MLMVHLLQKKGKLLPLHKCHSCYDITSKQLQREAVDAEAGREAAYQGANRMQLAPGVHFFPYPNIAFFLRICAKLMASEYILAIGAFSIRAQTP